MFIDKISIFVKSGKGGDGCISFRREKYTPNGGPDGGDGGMGGSVILRSDPNLNSLSGFRFKQSFKAESGKDGSGNSKSGKDADDLFISVPVGTAVFDGLSGEVLFDFSKEGQSYIAAKGGRGGKGNQHFATPTRQAPKFAKPGDEPIEKKLTLELKVIADVGLIGFPNVGKSTLLSRVTNAKPKIADYHFTTLYPNLGVVQYKNADEFVIADIPGLIEGASSGAGLGLEFLRHIERTRLLVHVIDASGSEGRDPLEDFQVVNNELFSYSEKLKDRPMAIVLNKTDIVADYTYMEKLKSDFEKLGYKTFAISAAVGINLDDLLNYIIQILPTIPKQSLLFSTEELIIHKPPQEPEAGYEISHKGDNWILSGELPRRLLRTVNLSDYESSQYFQRVLKNKGIFEALEREGIKDGDTLEVYGYSFEYYK